jgi:hypothetical protein
MLLGYGRVSKAEEQSDALQAYCQVIGAGYENHVV